MRCLCSHGLERLCLLWFFPPAASDDDVYNFHTMLVVAPLLFPLDRVPTLISARQQLLLTSRFSSVVG